VKIILKTDVDGVGNKGDIVDVADGYGRNYLVPKGLAMKATRGAETQAASMRRARDVKDAQDREAAQQVATSLVSRVVTIAARAGDEGKLFGSVTTADIVDAVQSQAGVELDRRQLHLDEPIKDLGGHQVTTRLHTEVEFPLSIEVVAE
jgi:large subunit ribosomal protein L9